MKKKFYSEVKKLTKFDETNIQDELVLIPGINLFNKGSYKLVVGNAVTGTLFAYKEHIYLNSDRYFEENEQIYNEIYFQSNIKLFEVSGKFVNGFIHEEMNLKVMTKNWTLKKYNICKDLECLPKSVAAQYFNLKYEYNHKFFLFCQ
jgi:hypothetical protein